MTVLNSVIFLLENYLSLKYLNHSTLHVLSAKGCSIKTSCFYSNSFTLTTIYSYLCHDNIYDSHYKLLMSVNLKLLKLTFSHFCKICHMHTSLIKFLYKINTKASVSMVTVVSVIPYMHVKVNVTYSCQCHKTSDI